MKQGQILTHTDGHQRKILGICGEVYFLSASDDFKSVKPAGTYYAYTQYELEKRGYIIPEEWEPEDGENYWFIDNGGIHASRNTDYYEFRCRKNFLGIFKTESEAQERLKEIKSKLGIN